MAATGLVLLAMAAGGAGGGPGLPLPPSTGSAPPGRRQDPDGGGALGAPPPQLGPGGPWGQRPSPRGTPRAGGDNGSRWGGGGAEAPPPGGVWAAPWGWGGPVGAMAVAYVALGGAVLVGLCQRHRALQSRKRRDPARRFFRVTPPGPHSPYGNVLCPTAAPRPPPEPGSPTAGPPGDPWGRAVAAAQEEEEEEEEEGYEHPDSEAEDPGEAYENEAGPPGARSSVGSYENGLAAAGGPWGAGPAPPSPQPPPWTPPASRLIAGLQRALLGAGERLDGRSEGSAGSQPYEDMAGGGLRAAARRGGGLGPEDDAGSYENMEGGGALP